MVIFTKTDMDMVILSITSHRARLDLRDIGMFTFLISSHHLQMWINLAREIHLNGVDMVPVFFFCIAIMVDAPLDV
ncbi:hypothetical protein BDW68DRAFT_131289 [Aspergillus falconensis]